MSGDFGKVLVGSVICSRRAARRRQGEMWRTWCRATQLGDPNPDRADIRDRDLSISPRPADCASASFLARTPRRRPHFRRRRQPPLPCLHTDGHRYAAHPLPPAAPSRTTACARRLDCRHLGHAHHDDQDTAGGGEGKWKMDGAKARRRVFPTRRTLQEDPGRRVRNSKTSSSSGGRVHASAGIAHPLFVLRRWGEEEIGTEEDDSEDWDMHTEPFLAQRHVFASPSLHHRTDAIALSPSHHLRPGFTQRPARMEGHNEIK
ncbi:hypothetical protein EDB89DRAFT_1905167 [Lactarius sanguifluus]|nr:hypothetical protein EDB89DRAFT_1905167 [Lactarius sanguifluus]